jgi:hypothetical protein
MSLSTPQIAAQLERVLASDPAAVAIAIRANAKQPWPDSLKQQGRDFQLRWCDSSLAIREALCDVEQHDPMTSGLVVITPLATHEVAEDIAARLAEGAGVSARGLGHRPTAVPGQGNRRAPGALCVDAADLDRRRAQGPYPPVANGFLDLETAWREVLHRFLGIEAARPDAVALLLWAMDPAADPRLAQLPAQARIDVMRWLGETAGVAGEMVLGCVDSGRTIDALPLGLVCGVVFAQDGEGQASLGQAAIRLERFVNGKHVGVAEGRAWARAAEQVVRLTGLDASRAVLDRADALLRDLRVIDFAHLSDVLPAALDQRLEDFALALTAHVAEPSETNLAQVELQADRALRHTLIAGRSLRERSASRWPAVCRAG